MEKGSFGINKILDIMDSCLAEPKSGKLNWPVSEKLNVPIAKRAKFMGPGMLKAVAFCSRETALL